MARKTLAVASGKGGVGKSTVSLNLAVALGQTGARVGLLDLDIYAPDIPVMVGLTRRQPAASLEVWRSPTAAKGGAGERPVDAYGIKIMSTQFFIAEAQSLALNADLAGLLVHRMARGLDWGKLDWLVLDLPPGTADLQQVVANQLHPDAALIVVTPQDVAHLDAKKAITMFERAKVPIAGGVENMSSLLCPCCGTAIQLFPEVSPERAIWADGVRRLGQIPMEPAVAVAGEVGEPIVVRDPEASSSRACRELADGVQRVV